MQATIEEIAMLLGLKEIELMLLNKQLAAAHRRLAELEKPDVQPELQAVR